MNENINFNKIKNQILPYFIEIYGEEYRELIESRMDSVEPIFYSTIDGKKGDMYHLETTKRIKLTFEFLEYNNVVIPDDIKEKCFTNNTLYYISQIPKANEMLDLYFGNDGYKESTIYGIKNICRNESNNSYLIQNSIKILDKFNISVSKENYNEWLKTKEALEFFEKIEPINKYISKQDEEFNNFDKQFSDLNILVDKANKLNCSIQQKYMVEFLNSIKNYMTDHDKNILNEYSSEQNWYTFCKKLDILKIVGSSFYDTTLLKSFDSTSEEKLNDESLSTFCKNSIIDKRIEYYKLIGIYDNQMPKEDFIRTREAKKNMISQKYIDDIVSKKEHFEQLADQEYIISTSTYEENLFKIKSLNLETDCKFKPDDIKNKLICIDTNVKMNNGKPEVVPVLFFSTSLSLKGYVDTFLIHEINHAIELNLLNYTNGTPLYKCGFEIFNDTDEDIRNYEAFSEIINQMIAMEISSAMHRDNVYLFDNKLDAKENGGTSYEQQRILIEKFWIKFKKEIMISRVSKNMDSLFNVVGKENFEKLNDLIGEYRQLPHYEMMDDIINNKKTDLTIKRNKILNESEKIYYSMVENANQLDENLTKKTL